MSCRLRVENMCESNGCKKPAHFGSLCAACFQCASPARRAVELLADRCAAAAEPEYVNDQGVAWLAQLWAA